MIRERRIPFGPKDAFVAIDASEGTYVRALVDYCSQSFLVEDRQIMQVYEELLHLGYWLRGFAPHNVLEIGTTGGSFFLLSRLATGMKAAIDIRDVRPRIHHYMFGHDWRFFHGDSQADQMRDDVARYCGSFDVIFIDGDHRYEGVKRDFELYRPLLSDRGAILFHDVDPNHVFKGGAGGEAWRFWAELDEGTKTLLYTTRSSGRIKWMDATCRFGGLGIWTPG